MADAAGDNAPIIIVKKVKKGGHGGHHGGAWKVAYADFVTAMMAFFLLMWLINATTEEQKKGIAEYFSPVPGAVGETTGGQGFFKGESVTSDGPMTNANAPVTVTIPIPTTSFKEDKTEGDQDKKAEPDNKGQADNSSQSSTNKDDQSANTDPEQAAKVLADLEDKQFKDAANLLRQAIQKIPDLKDLAENLIIDNTPEGLRIQIVDQEKLAMFPRGSTLMTDKAKLLMQQVAMVIEKMPEKIAISGHTDSTQYATGGKTYDNWDLSTDRANASRRALIESGLAPERIVNLAGKADMQPLDKDDPSSPRNRRISITLLRDNKFPGKEAAGSNSEAPDSSAPPATAPEAPPPRPKG